MVRGDHSTSNRTKPFASERFAFNSADTTPSNLGVDSDHEFLASLFGIPPRVDTLGLGSGSRLRATKRIGAAYRLSSLLKNEHLRSLRSCVRDRP